jgi:hypothetical protein
MIPRGQGIIIYGFKCGMVWKLKHRGNGLFTYLVDYPRAIYGYYQFLVNLVVSSTPIYQFMEMVHLGNNYSG